MAFGQSNTWLQVGIKTPFSTWFSSWISTGNWSSNLNTTNTKTKSNNTLSTYNSRYPWFDEDDYKKLEAMVDAKGITGKEKTQVMDQLYQYYYPQVMNSHKLDERQQQINNAVYENQWNPDGNIKIKLTNLSQMAKEKFGIDYNVDDDEVIWAMTKNIPNGDKLLEDYINNWNPELLYQAWIYNRPTQQWGTKDLINQASTNDKTWSEKNKLEKAETVTNYTNLLWLGAEKLDENAWKFADKWLDRWNTAVENSTESLKNKIESMSPEEIESYRKQFREDVGNKKIWTAYTEWDTIVEKLWNGIKWNFYYPEDDEAFMKWLISKKANLWEDISWADDLLRWEDNPNVIQFFWNIPSSAVKTFTATVRWLTNPYDTMKWLYTLAATKEWHQAILDRYWSWDAFARAMNSDPVGVADDLLAVAEIVSGAAWGVSRGLGKVTGSQSLINFADNVKSLNIWSANDALAQKTVWWLYGVMDNVSKLTDNAYVQWANKLLQDQSSLSKMVEDTKKVWNAIADSSVWQAVKNYKDEFINKLVGIDEADRKFIQENKDLTNQVLDWKKNVDTILDDVKEKVSEKRLANTEMWKEYGDLRKNKSKVVDTTEITKDMKKSLKKNGITIDKDWNLKFNDMSKFNAKQKAALIDAWNELKLVEKKKNINAWNVLDMRQKFDDKLNWDGKAMDINGNLSAVDKATEWLIREMRWVIDNRAKWSVVGLKELDAKYADALADMAEIRKDRLNPDWTFRDNARSKLRNITKAWNEERLARLEKMIPWITNDLKALDVGLTIERATKQWVWQYSKSIWVAWTIGALASWNIPAALVSAWVWILATPKNFVKVVQAYPDIVSKLQAWQELLPSDINRLQSLASRIQDWAE